MGAHWAPGGKPEGGEMIQEAGGALGACTKAAAEAMERRDQGCETGRGRTQEYVDQLLTGRGARGGLRESGMMVAASGRDAR